MKKIEDYLALPYTMIVRWSAEDELFVARVKEIEECVGHGATTAEALGMLRDNLEDFVSFSLERGDDVPIPLEGHEMPSGKWLQRVPRKLHKRLIECAADDGVSLNTYVTSCLASAVGRAEGKRDAQFGPGMIRDVHAGVSGSAVAVHAYMGAWPSQPFVPAAWTCPTMLEAKSYPGVTVPQVGVGSPTVHALASYSAFMRGVVEHMPTHFDTQERIGYDKEEKKQRLAYA